MSKIIKDLYWKLLVVKREQVKQRGNIIKIVYQSYDIFMNDYGYMERVEDCDIFEIRGGKITLEHVIG